MNEYHDNSVASVPLC